jgi:hypothetical protein
MSQQHPNYKNPLSARDIFLLLGVKFFFVIMYKYVSELWSWRIFYLITFAIIIYFIYELVVFEYSLENIDNYSIYFANPWFLLISFISILLFYLVIWICEISMKPEEKLFIITVSEVIIWYEFFFFLFIDLFFYLFDTKILVVIFEALNPNSTKTPPPSHQHDNNNKQHDNFKNIEPEPIIIEPTHSPFIR